MLDWKCEKLSAGRPPSYWGGIGRESARCARWLVAIRGGELLHSIGTVDVATSRREQRPERFACCVLCVCHYVAMCAAAPPRPPPPPRAPRASGIV